MYIAGSMPRWGDSRLFMQLKMLMKSGRFDTVKDTESNTSDNLILLRKHDLHIPDKEHEIRAKDCLQYHSKIVHNIISI